MVIEAQEHTDGGQPSTWAPLRSSLYRNLFIAQFASNIGTWMQSVAAQWFLVERHSSDVIVALVQTASLGPTLVLGLFAGALGRPVRPAAVADFFADVCRAGGTGAGGAGLPGSAESDIAVDVHRGNRLRLGADRTGLAGDSARSRPAGADSRGLGAGQRLGKCGPRDWTGDRRRGRGIGRTRSGFRPQRSVVRGNHRCSARLAAAQAIRAARARALRPGHRHRRAVRRQ